MMQGIIRGSSGIINKRAHDKTTAATQARISSTRTASQAMNESRYGDQQHNNTNDDDRTNVEWQQSAEHSEDP